MIIFVNAVLEIIDNSSDRLLRYVHGGITCPNATIVLRSGSVP